MQWMGAVRIKGQLFFTEESNIMERGLVFFGWNIPLSFWIKQLEKLKLSISYFSKDRTFSCLVWTKTTFCFLEIHINDSCSLTNQILQLNCTLLFSWKNSPLLNLLCSQSRQRQNPWSVETAGHTQCWHHSEGQTWRRPPSGLSLWCTGSGQTLPGSNLDLGLSKGEENIYSVIALQNIKI